MVPSNKKRLFPPFWNGLTESQSGTCPICGGGNARYASGQVSRFPGFPTGDTYDTVQGWCDACTNFTITRAALEDARGKKKLYLLSAYFRQLPDEPDGIAGSLIGIQDWEGSVASIMQPDVLELFDDALVRICRSCPGLGQASSFDYMLDWPLLKVDSPGAALFIINALLDAGFLQPARDGVGPYFPLTPTWRAYERLKQLESSGHSSERAFVAMSFDPKQDAVYDHVIRPAIIAAGYSPVRVDRVTHNEKIDDFIISEIRRCRFVVADFTDQKTGVYFEAGFGYGLGRRVIWMCNKSETKLLHFDTRQFYHILYDDFDKAREDLTTRIEALEGHGTYLVDRLV
jgi:nucleoside 2-deoxyribosyltransferase